VHFGRLEQSQVWSIRVPPIELTASSLFQYLQRDELLDQFTRGYEASSQSSFHHSDVYHRLLVEVIQQTQPATGAAADFLVDSVAVFVTQGKDPARRIYGLRAYLVNSAQEEFQPALPITIIADCR
jgi:hypothetical protein